MTLKSPQIGKRSIFIPTKYPLERQCENEKHTHKILEKPQKQNKKKSKVIH